MGTQISGSGSTIQNVLALALGSSFKALVEANCFWK